MKVECNIDTVELNDNGSVVPGVVVECSRCGKTVEVQGQSIESVKKCFTELRKNCPMIENNVYVSDIEDDEEDWD